MNRFTLLVSLAILSLLTSCSYKETPSPKLVQSPKSKSLAQPNIIFVVADDMGWRDTGYSGNPVVKTPQLDKMASSGLRFEQFYSAHATCAPGRMAILTGRTSLRVRMFRTVGPMKAGEATVGQALKTAGYETAHFGKWGLGRWSTHPLNSGFDEAIWAKGHSNNGASFYKGFSNQSDYRSNATDKNPIKTTGGSSVATMDLALDFIRKRTKRNQPFFTQVCFGSPHAPHRAHEDFKKLYSGLPEPDQNYYGEASGLDAAVGNLRRELRHLNIENNTIIWFVSDNGGIREGSGGRLKGQIGVRTLGLLEWPGNISKPTRTDIPVSHLDMYPTILDIVGLRMKGQPVVDGISLLPLFEGRMEQRSKPMGFTKGGGKVECKLGDAVWIDGSLKLRLTAARKSKPEHITLHDIYTDPSESKDLAAVHPDKVQEMLKELAVWRESVAASYLGMDY